MELFSWDEPACAIGASTMANAAIVTCRLHADTEAMNAHLVDIFGTVTAGAHAILVLDGAAWHGSKALCIPGNNTHALLPPYAPELNPIENVWAYLRANRLAISVFETYEEIFTQCCDASNFSANDTATVRSFTTRDYAKAIKG